MLQKTDEGREERDEWGGQRFEVRSSRFLELRTQNFELLVAPVSLHASRARAVMENASRGFLFRTRPARPPQIESDLDFHPLGAQG